ncbi:hypothetical protein N0V82_007166 [Gnomoniopsis sp. IMI 355080]|nr:hypothetical protein N0V82_007166 [Gnomoniopsis sp. IMI 355080]
MSLEVHHLHLSQSERIVWLMEELKIPYDLHVHKRDPTSALAPAELKSINPFGTAPFFRDTKVSPPVELSESGAIVEYILTVYGSSGATKLTRSPGDKAYAQYLQWLHFANGSWQPVMSRNMTMMIAGLTDENPFIGILKSRTGTALQLLDDRLAKSKYLADDELSTADIMTVFSLTTMRGFYPKVDLSPYPNVLRYLKDVAARHGYQEALRKGDFGMEPMIGAKVKGFTQFPMFAKLLGEDN